MRPLKACVMSVEKTGIKVRLETGLTADIPYANNINVGQRILVGYNHIEHKIVRVINTYDEGAIEPEKTDMEGEDHENETYSDDDSDYYGSTSCYLD